MSAIPSWRAGFELEVILGDLGEPRFERELRDGEAMDEASPTFCRAFASKLRERTRRAWSAPSGPAAPGFYVVPEYGLDPLNWPEDRLAGVELLTPPLPLDDAETVRTELFEAIYEIDGDFNFFASEHTANCGWHINIDAVMATGSIRTASSSASMNCCCSRTTIGCSAATRPCSAMPSACRYAAASGA
jgi:hypothetical protein